MDEIVFVASKYGTEGVMEEINMSVISLTTSSKPSILFQKSTLFAQFLNF